MRATTPIHRGHCLCRDCTFRAEGEPLWIGFCHCGSCRRATGGLLVAACGFPRVAVRLQGESLRSFVSSTGVVRRFCGRCGTALSYENELWPADVHLMLGAFERPQDLPPRFHIFAAEQLPWLRLSDLLPRFPATPSAGLESSAHEDPAPAP